MNSGARASTGSQSLTYSAMTAGSARPVATTSWACAQRSKTTRLITVLAAPTASATALSAGSQPVSPAAAA
ncbi:hypothetical protein D3C83_171770 [compost metagenome]